MHQAPPVGSVPARSRLRNNLLSDQGGMTTLFDAKDGTASRVDQEGGTGRGSVEEAYADFQRWNHKVEGET
eukprot:3415583-Rhodomonas_salina.2